MALTARVLSDRPEELEAWDRFVDASTDGTIFHLLAWKRVVQEVFHHTPRYLLAADGEEIKGILPLFEVRGLLTGRVLVSTPYAVYGGLCTNDEEATEALLSMSQNEIARHRARYVELRQLGHSRDGLPTKELYSTFVRPLHADPEAN